MGPLNLSIAATLTFVWLLTICLYRLFFHPLSHIPGPKLAAVTFLYDIYFNLVKPGQYIWEIKRLHEIYGPIIRINPREVHICDLEFLDTIYSTSQPRNKDAYRVKSLAIQQSVADTVDHKLHKIRRNALVPFFSKPAVSKLDALMTRKLDQLCSHFDLSGGSSVNLSDLYFAFGQDVIKNICFGYDEDLVGNMLKAASARQKMMAFLQRSHFNVNFGWLNIPLMLLSHYIMKHVAPGLHEFIAYRKQVETHINTLLTNVEEKVNSRNPFPTIFHELRDSSALASTDKTPGRLFNEASFIITAGSESTHRSLYIAHYFLLADPLKRRRLYEEITSTPRNDDWATLERLPYLSAVIAEANRLNLGLATRNCRVAPTPLRYKEWMIPAGTPMSTMSLFVNTNEKLYPDPWEFRPERWMDGGANERRKYMTSFGKGARRCLGVNLAHMILYRTLARMVRYDLRLYETSVKDVQFAHEFISAQPALLSKGVRVTVA